MTDEVTITEATEEDIPRVIDLLFHLDAHVSGAPREALDMTAAGEAELEQRLRSFLDNPYKLLVVARHPRGGIVGMGDIALWKHAEVWNTPERRDQWFGIIDDVWVEPEYRRRGINRRLVAALVAFARDSGVESLELEYSASNAEAAAAWKRLGFRTVGVRAAASVTDVTEHLEGGTNEP